MLIPNRSVLEKESCVEEDTFFVSLVFGDLFIILLYFAYQTLTIKGATSKAIFFINDLNIQKRNLLQIKTNTSHFPQADFEYVKRYDETNNFNWSLGLAQSNSQ